MKHPDDPPTATMPHDLTARLVLVQPTRRGEFFIRARVSDYWMDFECVKASYWLDESGWRGWSKPHIPLYEKKEELLEKYGGSPPTEDPEEGFVYLRGFLKWDGCMEVDREEKHTCSAEDLEDEYLCLRRIRQLADETMGHWEGDVPRDLMPAQAGA